MTHGPLVWEVTIALIVALLLFDYFFFYIRTAHVPTLAEAARWSAAYIGVAVLFGVMVWCSAAPSPAPSISPATLRRRRCRSTTCSPCW
jgi:tellurite resistance protein TerC